MADYATLENCIEADRLGFDYISTTLHGYTPETNGSLLLHDDFSFLKDVLDHVTQAVGGGGVITWPQQITARFEEVVSSSVTPK